MSISFSKPLRFAASAFAAGALIMGANSCSGKKGSDVESTTYIITSRQEVKYEKSAGELAEELQLAQKYVELDSLDSLKYAPNVLVYKAKLEKMEKYKDNYLKEIFPYTAKCELSEEEIYKALDDIKLKCPETPSDILELMRSKCLANKKIAGQIIKDLIMHYVIVTDKTISMDLGEMDESIKATREIVNMATGYNLKQSRARRSAVIAKLQEAKKAEKIKNDRILKEIDARLNEIIAKKESLARDIRMDEFRKICDEEYDNSEVTDLIRQAKELQEMKEKRLAELGCN